MSGDIDRGLPGGRDDSSSFKVWGTGRIERCSSIGGWKCRPGTQEFTVEIICSEVIADPHFKESSGVGRW